MAVPRLHSGMEKFREIPKQVEVFWVYFQRGRRKIMKKRIAKSNSL